MKSKVVGKKERALYKNLEELQKRKLIAYENKELELTKRGDLIFQKMKKELLPYLELNNVIKTQKPLKYTKRAQTVFRKK